MPMTIQGQSKRLFIFLLFCWLGINLVQSIFMEINSDEAYYFMYGRHLSIGYYDHPPMVAVLTHFSSFFFNGNLGVRFLTVLLQIGTLLLIWIQLDEPGFSKRKVIHFFLVSGSIVMFAAYGFITTPDPPLLFFTALFLYLYNRFLQEQKWMQVIGLAIAMAGLVYSKYQGFLVIGLVVLSNLRLLKNPRFWIAAVIAILLFTPHLWWQYENGFPSFEYQLIERSTTFKWKYFFEYLLNQFLVFNPFVLGIILYILFRFSPKNLAERAQHFLIAGFLLIFWATTFRGHAEPHWTIAAAIPMIILLNNKSSIYPGIRKYVSIVVGFSFLIVLAGRVLIATESLPEKVEFHGKESFYRAIEKLAGDAPVVFTTSYQQPSLYTYFTGKPATVVSSLEVRKTQYDLWNLENGFCNQPVFINKTLVPQTSRFHVGRYYIDGIMVPAFQPLNSLVIEFDLHEQQLVPGQKIELEYHVGNPTPCDIQCNDTSFQANLYAVFLKKDKLYKARIERETIESIIKPDNLLNGKGWFIVPADLPAGDYKFGLSCYSILGLSSNSNFQEKVSIVK